MNNETLPHLIDSHCHLDFSEFTNDLEQVIERAQLAGVSKIVTICTKPKNAEKILSIVDKFPDVYFAAGSHPLNKKQTDKFREQELRELSLHPKMIGIGETRLDYFYSSENAADQKKIFKLHIATARELSLPLIIHSRSADNDMITILKEEYKAGSFDCILINNTTGYN